MKQSCWVSDRPFDLRKFRRSLFYQLTTAIFEPSCADKCLFTVGYFQVLY